MVGGGGGSLDFGGGMLLGRHFLLLLWKKSDHHPREAWPAVTVEIDRTIPIRTTNVVVHRLIGTHR